MKGFFADKPYPGRFIAIGMDAGAVAVIYGATGRSPSSLKRIFVEQGDGIYMTAVDATVAIEGNPELLEYPAVRVFDDGIAVANGNQIENIESIEMLRKPKGIVDGLSSALKDIMYEPDEFNTPRITGAFDGQGEPFQAGLNIVRRSSPLDPSRDTWAVELREGIGSYISTYTGADVRPTPSFAEEKPLVIPLAFGSAEAAAQGIFDMLEPETGKADYRIGVVAAYVRPGEDPDIALVNKLSYAVS